MRRWRLHAALLFLVALSFGCVCQYFADLGANQPPSVSLELNKTQGEAPFRTSFKYSCSDPEGKLRHCEMRIDGERFAKAKNQTGLFPEGYEYPQFYWEAMDTPGEHSMEITALDEGNLSASKKVQFTVIKGHRQPVANLTLNETEGPAPFYPRFIYNCYDPEKELVSCEMKIDGKTFVKGENAENLFPEGYEYPDFYVDATKRLGEHEMEIVAVDREGLSASAKARFTVLKGLPLTKDGWYTCNNITNPPCDAFQEVYCDKFTPTDLQVREAASAAIARHPGAFSVNQLLDIYDWVYENVFYQNVPVNLTYQPYSPRETLSTKSGDCKNHAVLIASMVEAIGGSARVLLVPDCNHAFAEVYVGNKSEVDAVNDAIFAHYGSRAPNVRWHYGENETENWMIFDTAGGMYPGNTLPGCFDAKQTFVLYDCNRERVLKAPKITGIEYGPFVLYDKNLVIDPGYWQYFTYRHTATNYKFCRYKISLESLSKPMSWYVIPEGEYGNFENLRPYNAYKREEQVMRGSYTIDWSEASGFNLIIYNRNRDLPITVKTLINSTCYAD